MDIRTVLDRSWRVEGRVPPPVLLAGAWLAQSVVSSRRSSFGARAVGLVLGAGSVALAATTAADFARRGTSLDPLVPDAKELVTSGANALSRNPMYTGLVGLLVARAASRRSLKALVPAVVVAYLLDSRQIPAEEKVLAERFGPEFEAYRDATPRWVDARTVQRVRGMVPQLESLPWFERDGQVDGQRKRVVARRGEPRSYPDL